MTAISAGHRLDRAITPPRAAWAWLAIACLASLAALSTLRISPVAWQDEVQILDYGRTLLPGSDPNCSMSWADEDRPGVGISYLSCVASEIAFRLAGSDMAGPRLLTLAGAIAASGALMAYLRAMSMAPWIALAVSTMFLCDPMFAQSYRGARFDGWCMAAMLGACWAIRSGTRATPTGLGWLAVAGTLVAIGGLIWVSAIILVPLVALEILWSARSKGGRIELARLLRPLIVIFICACAAMALMLAPYSGSVGIMLQDTFGFAGERAGRPFDLIGGLKWIAIPMAMTPLMPSAAVIAIVWRRQWGVAIAMLVAIAIVLVTGPYGHRNLYLEPYLMVGLAIGVQAAWSSERVAAGRAAAVVTAALVAWAAVITIAARNANALRDWANRDPDAPLTELQARLGDAPRTVYVGAWRAYYAARELGWRYLRAFSDSPQTVKQLLNRCDAVVLDPNALQEAATPALIAELGFQESSSAEASGRQLFRIYVRPAACESPTIDYAQPAGIVPK